MEGAAASPPGTGDFPAPSLDRTTGLPPVEFALASGLPARKNWATKNDNRFSQERIDHAPLEMEGGRRSYVVCLYDREIRLTYRACNNLRSEPLLSKDRGKIMPFVHEIDGVASRAQPVWQ